MVKYSLRGKVLKPLPLDVFMQKTSLIIDKEKKAFAVLLYYSGVRVSELLRLDKSAFTFTDLYLYIDIGKRLKHGAETGPLRFLNDIPFMEETIHWLKHRRKGKVFSFNRITAWRLLRDYYEAYPHYFRLNAITDMLRQGASIPEVMSWTGHKSVSSLNSYIGLVSIEKISDKIGRPEK